MKPHALAFAVMTFLLAGCAVAGNALRHNADIRACRAPGPHDPAGPNQMICPSENGDIVVHKSKIE